MIESINIVKFSVTELINFFTLERIIIMEYGLIGEKLGHSYSKIIHGKLASYEYSLIELDKKELDIFLREKNFKGVNVTIPYKTTVIPYLDSLDASARKIGAVNAIVNQNGRLIGYNTDYYGFLYTLEHHNIKIKDEKVIVLGNGGAAKAIITVLKDLKASEIIIVSRSLDNNTISYEECYKNHTDGKVIVNCTPVGMYPNIDSSPLNLENFNSCTHLIDLIYNPDQTKLLKEASQKGIYGVGGLEMLIAQAKVAAEYFLDTQIDNSKIQDIKKDIQ